MRIILDTERNERIIIDIVRNEMIIDTGRNEMIIIDIGRNEDNIRY